FVVLFVYSLFGEKLPAIMKKIFVVWGGAIIVTLLFLPVFFIMALKPAFDIYLLATGLYITPALVYLAFKREKGSILALAGMAAMFFTGLNDILYGNLIINTFNMASIGTCVFIIMQAYLLSSLFSGAYRRSQEESGKNLLNSEENRKQNEFIRTILASASGSIRESAQKMVEILDGFRTDSHGHAASIEEVAASIEEISAATQSIAKGTEHQDTSLVSLNSALEKLASILSEAEKETASALNLASEISVHAKAGSESISVMKGSMDTINESSSQMNGIIQIINDISDRINLLSLNAAIEAARAGNAGRGFAVVADEISKLADATAASIKDIDILIRTNDGEIRSGSSNIHCAVGSVSKIIDNVGSINTAISAVSGYVTSQVNLNSGVNVEAHTVRTRAEEIRSAMSDQQRAVDEISGMIASINEISQNNSRRIEEMTDFARSLTEMIDNMTGQIETYGKA
ncbi:MAG: methyl-accepting chemotaxis protein, partial [Spirochaetota bacterium]